MCTSTIQHSNVSTVSNITDDGVKSILRVKSVDESIRSCYSKPARTKSRCADTSNSNINSNSNSASNHENDISGKTSSSTIYDRSESSSSCCTTPSAKTRSSVQFETVEVREYSIVLGDNPSCRGPPMSLGWKHSGETEFPFDSFEQQRENNRRAVHEMKVPADVRRSTLRGWEVSTRSMLTVQLESETIRKQRLQTATQVQRKEERKCLAKRIKRVAFCKNTPVLL